MRVLLSGKPGAVHGTGLGITFFGVFMSAVYGRNFTAPAGLTPDQTEQAARSIGDSYLVAHQFTAEQSAAVIAAGKAAFSSTHSVLLLAAAMLIGALAVAVFFLLAKVRAGGAEHV